MMMPMMMRMSSMIQIEFVKMMGFSLCMIP